VYTVAIVLAVAYIHMFAAAAATFTRLLQLLHLHTLLQRVYSLRLHLRRMLQQV